MHDELSKQGSIQTPWFRTNKGCIGFPEQTQTFSQNQHRLLVQGMYDSKDARGLFQRLNDSHSDGRVEWRRTPTMAHLSHFICMGLG
jgi:hypothetical protein